MNPIRIRVIIYKNIPNRKSKNAFITKGNTQIGNAEI